ncbi:hypothetical protein FNL55_15480 [Tardiphaga sp. vice352]|uniref:hypothetical protein n=1 Tax=unclassified Tardiphaga TaxID=2631404 RepID=UPI0011653BE6|nr:MULTISPECIES: hypothetical protein [unclassified Tardiphaga]QDM17235.1 hypothetical protein FNL53_15770 [Tardiphaga sp. vice278]QDM22215.1 hypothetical protein FIU28_14415 [Tardiphaga sp. vice154]QDM32597.1 hypothetical protein FNL55_15480 [Tardiphaga sp. vice352]
MDWSLIIPLMLVGLILLWRQSKREGAAKSASARLERDAKLYDRIKEGVREYDFRGRQRDFWKAKDAELLFETAHLSAFHVDHFAETRIGFYFKDLNEYGLYGFFAGNDDDVYHSYYRTDRTFQKEEMLLTNDDD